MTSIYQRKEIGLDQKLKALDAEFNQWSKLSSAGKTLEKHHTQVLALTGHLKGLRRSTEQIFKEARDQHTILIDARETEALILGIRRIWEFFRSKLVQRWDEDLRRFLQLADELAWSCYQPALEASQSARREPPLVFLNGGLSPFALSRNRAFRAEDVPGQPLAPDTYDPVLQRLPIAVIGVPWHQTAHLPDLPVVAHETGHAVEQNLGLHEEVLAALATKLNGAAHLPQWQAWAAETFADLWGALTLGPAFVSSLIDFLAGNPVQIQNEVASTGDEYPTANLRIRLCLRVLERMGFDEDAQTLKAQWELQYGRDGMPAAYVQDAADVADALLDASFSGLGGAGPLLNLPDLRFKAEDDEYARKGAKERSEAKSAESANTARRLVAAARQLYDQDPQAYIDQQCNSGFISDAQRIIKPGTRNGERLLSQSEKESLATVSERDGIAWFAEFAKWANPADQPIA
ncbi:hypothetical protein [Bradyrhizobium japonicum]|uniref:hypothetical protein n=1 Tax=Bradyrhizobium japonicum TaxID=375 RepID=UPI00209E727D|nr:hypothetical protein [Bradyrhizobium japonicum]MCP1783886.1 hypothetical protein [Bradyrhizobium japonicum]MCP1963826.1 hypothetical protein [Bradyrhizobium japonicum]